MKKIFELNEQSEKRCIIVLAINITLIIICQILGWVMSKYYEIYYYKYCTYNLSGQTDCQNNSSGLTTRDCSTAQTIRDIYIVCLIMPICWYGTVAIINLYLVLCVVNKYKILKLSTFSLIVCDIICATLYFINASLINGNQNYFILFSQQTFRVCLSLGICYSFKLICKCYINLIAFQYFSEQQKKEILQKVDNYIDYQHLIVQQPQIQDLNNLQPTDRDLLYKYNDINQEFQILLLQYQSEKDDHKNHKNQIIMLENDIKRLKQENYDKDIKIVQLEQQLKEQKKQACQTQKQINLQLRQELQEVTLKNEIAIMKIATIQNKIKSSKLIIKFTSAIFELFRINQDIGTILQGAYTDVNEFAILKIVPRKQVLQQKINRLSDLDFNDAYELSSEYIRALFSISIKSNAQGSHSVVKVLQDIHTKQFYIIKQSMRQQDDSSISQLQQLFLPTLIAEFLLDKFVETLNKLDDEEQPYKFRFQEQFIFQSGTSNNLFSNKEYFYAQKISKGDKFIIYNGRQNNQPDIKVCQFMNAFTIFSLKYSQDQLMVDNLQGTSDTLYDPIINTNDGLFNEEDQGKERIDELIRYAEDVPKFYKKLLLSLQIGRN